MGNGLLLAMLTVYIVAFILDLNSGGMSDRGLMCKYTFCLHAFVLLPIAPDLLCDV